MNTGHHKEYKEYNESIGKIILRYAEKEYLNSSTKIF